MDNREQLRRITELTEQIAGLPKGYLSKKTIGGKVYYVSPVVGKRLSSESRVSASTVRSASAGEDKIEKRKELQAQLRMLKSQKSRRNEATGMKCTLCINEPPWQSSSWTM